MDNDYVDRLVNFIQDDPSFKKYIVLDEDSKYYVRPKPIIVTDTFKKELLETIEKLRTEYLFSVVYAYSAEEEHGDLGIDQEDLGDYWSDLDSSFDHTLMEKLVEHIPVLNNIGLQIVLNENYTESSNPLVELMEYIKYPL